MTVRGGGTKRQVMRLLIADQEDAFLCEARDVLRTGLETVSLTVDAVAETPSRPHPKPTADERLLCYRPENPERQVYGVRELWLVRFVGVFPSAKR
jgi:hypothetical protein